MVDIAEKIDSIENLLNENKEEINKLKNEKKYYVTYPNLYKILYEAIYSSVFGSIENQEELKHGLLTTVRNNIHPFRDAILQSFLAAESESVLFEEQDMSFIKWMT